MRNAFSLPGKDGLSRNLGLARVLLVHGELAPRLALQTILQAAGYSVDVAASPAEARFKLDDERYELVLTEARFGSDVLPFAKVKEYRPATAVVNACETDTDAPIHHVDPLLSIHTEDVPSLLEHVAELIGLRASRRYRPLRHAV